VSCPAKARCKDIFVYSGGTEVREHEMISGAHIEPHACVVLMRMSPGSSHAGPLDFP